MKTQWEEFFDGHAPVYHCNVFTKNTIAEVDFLTEVLEVAPDASILDVGCGTGRHAIELARRGYVVTGVDLSAGMLQEARQGAATADVQVTWRQCDAAQFSAETSHDGVICLCEGAFGLLSGGDDAIGQPLSILRNVAAALKPSAKCLFTVLNGFAMIRRHTQSDVAHNTFDPLTVSEVSECEIRGSPDSVSLRERAFVPTELRLLFGLADLEVLNIWGGPQGTGGSVRLTLTRWRSWSWHGNRRRQARDRRRVRRVVKF